MSTNLSFPLSDFYEALNSKNVKEKLEPFIAQFRKKNMYTDLHNMELHNLLMCEQIDPSNTEQVVIAIDEVQCTNGSKIYMLPVIYEIALEKYLKRSEEGMELYFVDRGAENTKEMRRLGLNYVELAAEFIFNCAKVKPYRLIENRELKEESNFKRTVKVLNNKGINEQEKCIYYIPSYPAQTRKKFLKKLKHISAEPYISFVISNYLEEINLNKKCDLDIKKLLLHGDSFLTSTMVEIIEEELSKMSQNFINKKKYLNLLNDLIKSGEIESIYLVNTSDFIREIGEEIKKVKGNLGFTQGEYIYPMVEASKQDKKDFYIDFLRMLEIWAYCMPSTDEGEESDVLRIYEDLKKKNFVFPKNMLLKKIKEEMDENLSLNQERNETLMRIIDEDERVSQRNNGSYVSSKGEFKFHFPEYREKLSYIELDELHYKVYETKKRIARLSLDKQELTENMKFIKDFVESWDEELEKLDIEDEDPHELQMLVDEGDLCGEQYKLIKPFYELYVNKRITFEEFAEKIEFLEHPDENSVNRSSSMRNSLYNRQQDSQISLEQRLQNTKHSKASESIRKNIQNEYSNQYGYEKYETEQKYEQEKYHEDKRSSKKSSKISQNQKENSQTSKENFSSESESNNQSRVSSDNQLSVNKSSEVKPSKLSQGKKLQSIKRPIDLGYSKKLNQDNYENERSEKESERKSQHSNAKSSKKSYNLRQEEEKEQSEKQETSKVSSFEEESESQSESEKEKESFKSPPKKVVHFKTERERSPMTSNNPMSSLNGLKTQSNQKQPESQKFIEEKYTPKKKSVIKHSVISKSSYHSQPHEAQMIDSGYNEGNSVMNDYEIENVPVQFVNQNGINLKKSSIKRTESSAMRNSSHKRLQESQHNLSKSQKKSSHQITEAVSPFKKKKESESKDIKIKESFIKDYEFVRGKNESEKKRTHIKIDDNFTYEDAFRRRDENERDYHNDSEISSESESVVERRNNKLRQKEVIKEIVKINLNDLSEYYVEETSILKKSNNNIKKATKNLILFDSNHSNNYEPLKQSKSANKYHEDYEIVEDHGNNKIKKLTDKISEMSKNTSKFAHSKGKSSGIKLISKNDNKSFDKLYKNDYGNDMFGETNGERNRDQSSKRRYDEVNFEFNNDINLANSSRSPFKTENKKFVINEKMRQSEHDSNKDFNNKNITSDNMISSQHTSMEYEHQNIDYEYENFKVNMIKKRIHNEEESEINEPENQPMLYSYCSDKSIHSRLTDSHTRRGNNRSSNNQEFKTCFMNMDKEVLPLTGAKTKIVSNSFSSLDKAFNFLDCKGSNAKSSSKVHSMADAISEKNAKNSILLYKLEREKTRLVENLQHKIKELEVNGKMMKTKYALKDQSMRENLSSRNLSEPELKLNTKIVKTSRQSTEQNNNSIMYNNHELSNRLGSHMNAMTSRSNEKLYHNNNKHEELQEKMTHLFGGNSPQKVINTKEYSKFFEQYKQHSYKKTLHKKKGLFIKNEEIEIGYMINKKDKYLVMNVFVTPYAGSIKNVKTEVVVDNNIAVRHKQAKVDLIEVKKQEVISVSFFVQNLPYKLPLIKMSFDSNRAYSTNTFVIGLPATIVHFSEMLESTEGDEGNEEKDLNKSIIMRTDIFKCSKKLNRTEKLIEVFPAMKEIKKDKKLTVLECAMTYQDNISNKVLLSIVMNEHTGEAVIYGRSGELKENSVHNYLEYLMATMQLVLEEE